MKAIIEDGKVTALVSGDVDGGVLLPVGTSVSVGWNYANEIFSAPPEVSISSGTSAQAERSWRTVQLAESDWLVTRHRDELDVGSQTALSSKQFSRLQAWRQALRDWPGAGDTLDTGSRPQSPKWLARLSQRAP
ncbi:hypothetical protein [Pseudomonas sp. TWP3-1]|uniref:hypothetical protein n=1 Tax=unclassified Pseudomonas TaxID=196821 RepID=UPI003CE70B8B